MKRVIDVAITAAAAMLFIVCFALFCWRRRSNDGSYKLVASPPARLRVQTGIDCARDVFLRASAR